MRDDDSKGATMRRFATCVLLMLLVGSVAHAAPSATGLTSGSSITNGTTFSSTSVSPAANRLVLVSVYGALSGTNNDPSSVSGAGLTFTKVASVSNASEDANLTLWRAMSASPSSGAITITYPSTKKGAAWSIVQFDGVDTSGTNGSGAIVQWATGSGTNTSSRTVTLAAFASTNNGTYGAFGIARDASTAGSGTPGSGFTELHDVPANDGTQSYAVQTEYRGSNDTTVNSSWSATVAWYGGIAVEVRAASGGSAPSTPSGLSAATASGTQINLAWTDTSGNETGFKIERKTGAGGTYAQIATTAANVITFNNTGLSTGSTYFYRIRSTNAVGDSAFSNEASATASATLNAPAGLSATGGPGAQTNLTWTDTSSNETGFKIERKTGVGGTYAQIAIGAANITTFDDSGLSGNTTYFYRIRATNAAGDSAYSNEAGAATPAPNVTANATVTYRYDPFGNLIETNAGGVITTLVYDRRGRKTSMSDPDIMGNWTYRYNALGELVWQCDPNSRAIQSTGTPPDCTNAVATRMTYDKLGRMTNRAERDLSSTWTHDSCTKGIGKLCQASATNGYSRTYGYDSVGRPSTLTTSIDTTYVVTTGYDFASRVETITYPNTNTPSGSFQTKNVYNAFGYLSEVHNNADGRFLWQAQSLSAAGNITQEALGDPGVLTGTRGYDVMDRLVSTTAAGSAGTVHSLAFTYDPLGNVTQRSDSVNGVTENFTYDALNRLLQSSGPGLVTRSLDYNTIGNITYKSDAGLYTYGVKPHAVASVTGTVNASYSYDANGNLTSGAGRTLTYTSFNLPNTLAQGTDSFQYTYNVDHERVRLVVTRSSGVYTTTYLHPAGSNQLLYEKEIQPGGTVEHRHYVNAMGLVGVYVIKGASSGMRHFHKDHLGSIVAITNEAGARIETLAYEAFGKRRFPSGTADPFNALFGITTERGFTEHEHLDELQLIHMNGRVYDPVLGRFMTPDPTVPNPLNLQSFNRYSYVYNNPLKSTDPSGFCGADDGCSNPGEDEGSGGGYGGSTAIFSSTNNWWTQLTNWFTGLLSQSTGGGFGGDSLVPWVNNLPSSVIPTGQQTPYGQDNDSQPTLLACAPVCPALGYVITTPPPGLPGRAIDNAPSGTEGYPADLSGIQNSPPPSMQARIARGIEGFLGNLVNNVRDFIISAVKFPYDQLPRGTDGRNYFPPDIKGNPELVRVPHGPGALDIDGNRWIWARDQHGGPHWDAQHPDGSHTNVTPEGVIIGPDNFPNRQR